MTFERATKRLSCCALLFSVLILGGCTGLVFHPADSEFIDPAEHGLVARDVYFRTDDDVRLHAWFLPAQTEHPKGTVLFLHGNAQNISAHILSVWWLPREGFNVFTFDYRGYGESEGRPSIVGVQLDYKAALRKVFTMPEVDPERVAVFGQSLGGAIAITGLEDSKYRLRLQALVIESAYASLRETARDKLGGFVLTWPLQYPLSWLFNDDYRPVDAIGRLAPLPVLIIHSKTDRVIPLGNGERLFRAAGEPKQFWILPEGGHIAAMRYPKYRRRLAEYLRAVMDAPTGVAGEHPQVGDVGAPNERFADSPASGLE